MLGRAVVSAARRVLGQQAVRRGHGHAPANPGPNCTMDMMPVPHIPYQTVYNELQAKFNVMLGVSVSLLVVSLIAAKQTNLFISEQLAPPMSWRQRK